MTATRTVLLAGACILLCGPMATRLRGDETGKFEVYRDSAGEYRWRLKAGNGAVIATPGQGYKEKADAEHGIELMRKAGSDAKLKFEVYEDAKKEHRWRLKAANGQVVATSGEGYHAEAEAEKAVERVKAAAAKAEIVEVKP